MAVLLTQQSHLLPSAPRRTAVLGWGTENVDWLEGPETSFEFWDPDQHHGPGPCGRNSVRMELRRSVGIGTRPRGAGNPALVESLGCPGQGAVTRRQERPKGTAWQCLAEGGGERLGQVLSSHTPSCHALGLSTEELEAKIGLYFGGLRQAGVTSLPDGGGRLSLFKARLSTQAGVTRCGH